MVHVVDLVRHDDAYSRERAVIGGEIRQGSLIVCRKAIRQAVLPIDPGIMFAYISPTWQIREPTEGRSSEYPANVSPAASNACPRFGVVKVCGHDYRLCPASILKTARDSSVGSGG